MWPWGFALAARRTFFCFAKRKYAKKRRPGVSALLRRVPCATRRWRGLRNSGYALRQSSPFFRPNLRCSASHKGPERRHGATSGLLFQTLFRAGCLGARWFSPSRRQRRATEGFAEIARGLSEARRAEFRSALSDAQHREEVLSGCAREDRVAQGTGEAGADAGSPSFCLLFLGEARKSEARRKRETPRSNERKTHKLRPGPWLKSRGALSP